MALGVAGLVQGIEPAQERAGVRIDQVNLAQIPGGVTDLDAGEVTVPGGDFEALP